MPRPLSLWGHKKFHRTFRVPNNLGQQQQNIWPDLGKISWQRLSADATGRVEQTQEAPVLSLV